ncbi:hypothetical protein A5892_09235 [Halotalea alkalilenta]|uniref:Spore coat protein U/FanG domain-containing protein n=1 Tax=Halotalea alkalilenta TaxID=376489 RepID=A0A172YEC5_9GAMM|nr:hypothetical protein A5892_09235 [Halotalea alkalilenta]
MNGASRSVIVGLASALLPGLWIASASAAPTSTFQVSATVSEGCLVDGARPAEGASLGMLGWLDFGVDSALSTATHTASLVAGQSVTLNCTPGVALSMWVDGGQHYDDQRRMRHADGSGLLGYSLFSDAAMQQPIAVNQEVPVNTAASPENVQLPLYARLSLPGDASAGSYHDTLVVTLQW